MAQLPAVGGELTKRIVQYREESAKRHPGVPCFRKPADLLRVKGIGPKTLQKITPFLLLDKLETGHVDKPSNRTR